AIDHARDAENGIRARVACDSGKPVQGTANPHHMRKTGGHWCDSRIHACEERDDEIESRRIHQQRTPDSPISQHRGERPALKVELAIRESEFLNFTITQECVSEPIALKLSAMPEDFGDGSKMIRYHSSPNVAF